MNYLTDLYNTKYGPIIDIILQYPGIQQTRPHLVGGAVRDILLNIEHKTNRIIGDLDIAIFEKHGPCDLATFLSKETGFVRQVFKNEGGHKVERLIGPNSEQIDITQIHTDLNADLLDRDFTINAMAIDIGIQPGELRDPHNFYEDIVYPRIKQCRDDSFHCDPLRVLRAFRFMAELNAPMEADTCACAKANNPLSVAPGRLHHEIMKIFAAPHSYIALAEMDRIGLLTKIFPPLEKCKGIKQNHYHKYDVFGHVILTYLNMEKMLRSIQNEKSYQSWWYKTLHHPIIKDYINVIYPSSTPRYALIKLAVLLHDIGKPSVEAIKEDGEPSFFGHEDEGRNLVENGLHLLGFPQYEIDFVAGCVGNHMQPMNLSWNGYDTKAVYRYFRKTGIAALAVLLLSNVDRLSSCGDEVQKDIEDHEKTITDIFQKYIDKPKLFVNPKPIVNGLQIMTELCIGPGKTVGILLDAIMEATAVGTIKTEDEAIGFAKEYLATMLSDGIKESFNIKD